MVKIFSMYMNSLFQRYSLAFFLLFVVVFFSACKERKADDKSFSYKDFLPMSKGGRGEIMLWMDSSKWKNELGNAVREVYMAPLNGLPQPSEAIFKIYHVEPTNIKDLIKEHHSILIILSLDNRSADTEKLKSFFSNESLERIKNDDKPYLLVKQNEYARNQQVVFLIGKDDEQLIKHLQANANQLQEIFLKTERERSRVAAFRGGVQSGKMERYQQEHGFKISIPAGYQEAKDIQYGDSGFVFLRFIDNANVIDRNIFIAYKPYTSQEQLQPDSILKWRTSLGSQYMKDPDRGSYLTDQTDMVPYFSQKINFKGHYAVELRALWKLTSNTAGGPFVGYLMVDEKKNRLYYIEGFIYAPSDKKRDLIREVESILWTFSM